MLGQQVEQLPGPVLWIPLFEVGEESRVREVLETRGIIGHHVTLSWEKVSDVAVAVLPLVLASKAAKVGGRLVGRDRSLVESGNGGGVVGQGGNGEVARVEVAGNDGDVSELGEVEEHPTWEGVPSPAAARVADPVVALTEPETPHPAEGEARRGRLYGKYI